MNRFPGPSLLRVAHDCAPDRAWTRLISSAAKRRGVAARVPFVLVSVVWVCFSLVVSPVQAQESLPPDRLTKLESVALEFYDHVRRDHWPEAELQFQQIAKLAEPVLVRFDAAGAPLTKAVVKSMRALHHHDRDAALHAANKIIEWAASEKKGTQANVPPEVIRLGFLARELQIETGAGNAEKLAARMVAIRQCWDKLRTSLETSGDLSLVHDGEATIRQLELTITPEGSEQAQNALFTFIEAVVQHFDQGNPR